MPVGEVGVVLDELSGRDQVPCHERGQVLGQRPQFLAGLDVQFLTRDLLGDHRVVVGRPLRIPVLPGPVPAALKPLLTTLAELLLGRPLTTAELTPLTRLGTLVTTPEATVVITTELTPLTGPRTLIPPGATVITPELTPLTRLGTVITTPKTTTVVPAELTPLTALRTIVTTELTPLTALRAATVVTTAELTPLTRLGTLVTTPKTTTVVPAELTPLTTLRTIIPPGATVITTEITTLTALGAATTVVPAELTPLTALRAATVVTTAELTPLTRLGTLVTTPKTTTVVPAELTPFTGRAVFPLHEGTLGAPITGPSLVTAVKRTPPLLPRLGLPKTIFRAFARPALPTPGALPRTRRLRPTLLDGTRLERLTSTRLTRRPTVPTASVRPLLPLTSLAVVAAAFLFLHLYMVDGTQQASDAERPEPPSRKTRRNKKSPPAEKGNTKARTFSGAFRTQEHHPARNLRHASGLLLDARTRPRPHETPQYAPPSSRKTTSTRSSPAHDVTDFGGTRSCSPDASPGAGR
ncbi:hypothetical protein ABGB12_33105 [Actinocorallia sp. B10E7]|uniref:hypothetical protein n=1 Tax=Actinocorallia sp. B10E7 TaxID=3153558 RepID=UPI00325F8441